MITAPTRTRCLLGGLLVATACPLLVLGGSAPASAGPAATPEYRVNTTTADNQLEPSVAVDAEGNHVIVWRSFGQDGNGFGIYAQRYNAAGTPLGAETRVNTTTADHQSDPNVAMSAEGDYVVAWTSFGQDGSGEGVYAQRYDAAGVPQGTETLVTTTTTDRQFEPAVAMDADGDHVVAWTSASQDGSAFGVYAQRYDAGGTPRGTETLVNSTVHDGQSDPSVAMDADGDYVITWTSAGQDGSGYGIYAQRFSATGTPHGYETRVNATVANPQFQSSVAMDADGDYVVAWTSEFQDGSFYGIYAQRYTAAGRPLGAELLVNTTTGDDQATPSVAMDADGDHAITWTSWSQDGSGDGVYAQRFNAAGVPQGTETRINATTFAGQNEQSVAMDADGDYVTAWTSEVQDGSVKGVYARRYRGPTPVDVGLTQSDSRDTVAVGGRLSYRVRVANLTDDVDLTGVETIDRAIGSASGIYVVSAVPDGATFVSSSGTGWTCGVPTTTIKCRLATTIRAQEAAPGLLLTFTASGAAGPSLHQARVYEAQADPVASNNVEVERTSVQCAVEFTSTGYAKGESSAITATATRHGTDCGAASVRYDSTPGTASLGADFTDVAGTLTWTDADTVRTFTVPVFDDALDENTERLSLSLGNPVGVLLGGNDLATGSISDNDEAPRINFTSASSAATEATGLVELTVRLSAVSGRSVNITLGRGGTATSGVDYITESRLTIPAGQRTATFDVEIVDDALAEGSETANLFLSKPDGATVGSVNIHRITIGPSD